ncbi:MAG: glycosyltransferase family 2 protein [Candidatus Heimdallarchaeota archaeon]
MDGVHTKTSIIVCTKDRPEHLNRCLSSIRASDPLFDEILIVDNGSQDKEAVSLVASEYDASYMYFPQRGLARARNFGISKSQGDILIFADDDFSVKDGWIENLLPAYKNPKVGCCAGRMIALRKDRLSLAYEESMSFDRGNQRREFRQQDLRLSNLFSPFTMLGQKRLLDKTPLPYAVGYGFFSFRKSILTRVGLFDPSLGRGTPGVGGDDVDLYYRILKAGYTIIYEPRAQILHNHRSTFESILLDARNAGISLKKLQTKYAGRDLYMTLMLFGTFFHLIAALLGSKGQAMLYRMVREELLGFLKTGSYSSAI